MHSLVAEIIALVDNPADMTGSSVKLLDWSLDNYSVFVEYRFDVDASRSVYCTVECPGRNSGSVFSFLGDARKLKYGIKIDILLKDRISMCFEAS